MEAELPQKICFKNIQRDETGNSFIPNPMYDYSKRSKKKIRSKRQARRHESLCYLLSFFGHDYASFEEEGDLVQTESVLIENNSPFFKLISNEENLKHWLDFISKSGDKQDDFLANYESQIISHESSIAKLESNPFISAHKRFLKIDKNLQPIYRKEYSLICLKKFESEIVPLFLFTPNSEHYISEIHCPFDRMVLHGLSQYLNIKSKNSLIFYVCPILMPSSRLTAENANFLLNCSEIELNLKATRRSFVLFLFFDFTFTSLLWLIYCTTKGLSIEEAYEEEIKKYNIDSSLFDVAVASVVRFILLNLFYTIFKINHWIPAAIITFASSSFLISKVIIFAIKGTHKIITDYLILIISFLIVWGQTGYLDMKIFSIVKKKAVLLDTDSTISNTSRANYGSVNAPRGILSEVTSFYASPLDSPRDFSDDETDSQSIKSFSKEDQRRLRYKNSKSIKSTLTNIPETGKNSKYLEFEKLSEEMLERLVSIKNDSNNWNLTEFNLIDLLNENNIKIDSIDANIKCCLQTKYFSGIGKVFKLDTVIPFEESLLLKVLRDEVEECANWNVTVKEAKIVTKIRQDLSILHVCVHEQAGGLVSQRDFVNLNRYYFNDNMEHILATIACKSDEVPVLESYVRGENGPTGYFFSRIDDNFTKFTWILNVNLKGWLPQYLIDQSLTVAQKDFIVTLIKHLNNISF